MGSKTRGIRYLIQLKTCFLGFPKVRMWPILNRHHFLTAANSERAKHDANTTQLFNGGDQDNGACRDQQMSVAVIHEYLWA